MAIVKLLLEIISIDEKIDERETAYFEKVKKDLNLNSRDHYNAKNYNTLFCLSIIKNMTNEQKKHYTSLMKKTILIDGVIEPSELIAYEDICQFCDIQLEDINLEN